MLKVSLRFFSLKKDLTLKQEKSILTLLQKIFYNSYIFFNLIYNLIYIYIFLNNKLNKYFNFLQICQIFSCSKYNIIHWIQNL